MAPIVGRFGSLRGGRDGAIAQLGERVVRNDEVGGSIPPGSTTLRPSGYAWRSHASPKSVASPAEAKVRRRAGLAIAPRRATDVVKTVLSAAKRRSQYSAWTRPMPAVAPFSMPITGFGIAG